MKLRSVIGLCLTLLWSLPGSACEQQQECIETGQWEVAVAFGLGARSNPLEDGDAIPLVVIADVAYYGEQFYLDNAEIGFRWVQRRDFGFETYLAIDKERAFFSFWHPNNLLIPVGSASPGTDDGLTKDVSIDEVASRRWAAHAGGRAHWYGNDQQWLLAIETDITGTHNGQKIELAYQYQWHGDDWQLSLRPSITWKSTNLLNYYYGIAEEDDVAEEYWYRVKSGFQPAVSVQYVKRMNENWQGLLHFSYQKLNDSMTQSPLVEDNQITSFFIGVGYRF